MRFATSALAAFSAQSGSDLIRMALGEETPRTKVYSFGSDWIRTKAIVRPICGGIGHGAARHAEVRRLPDARPCDGKGAGLSPGPTATSRSSRGRPPES